MTDSTDTTNGETKSSTWTARFERRCLICSAIFDEDDDHNCPPDVARRRGLEMWARLIQNTFNNRGKGWGRRAALREARKAFPTITEGQVARIGSGEIEWSELDAMFDPTSTSGEG